MMEDAMLDQARINRHLHCVIFLDPYLFDSEQTLVFSREFAPHLLVYFYNFHADSSIKLFTVKHLSNL